MNLLLMRNTQIYTSTNLDMMWNKNEVQTAIGYCCKLQRSEKIWAQNSVRKEDAIFVGQNPETSIWHFRFSHPEVSVINISF